MGKINLGSALDDAANRLPPTTLGEQSEYEPQFGSELVHHPLVAAGDGW